MQQQRVHTNIDGRKKHQTTNGERRNQAEMQGANNCMALQLVNLAPRASTFACRFNVLTHQPVRRVALRCAISRKQDVKLMNVRQTTRRFHQIR